MNRTQTGHRAALALLLAGTAMLVYGCATIGPCTSAVVSAQRRAAVASGMSVQDAQARVGLEDAPAWQMLGATVLDTTLWGALGYGVYVLADEALGSGSSSAADVTITATDSSRVVVAVDGASVGSSLNSSSFNSSKSSSSSRTSSGAVQ